MTNEGEWIAGEAIVDAVNFANDFRELFGADKIDDLPPSDPGESHSCVLANAFNFDCWVEGGRSETSNQWGVYLRDYDKAVKLAEILGDDDFVKFHAGMREEDEATEERWGYTSAEYIVNLPSHIGQIASAFDNEELDSKYYNDDDQGY